MLMINKLIFFIFFIFLINFNSINAFENRIEFQILDKIFTTIDLKKRENYLKFVTNNSEVSKEEILRDFTSALIFNEYYIMSKNKFDLELKIENIYQDILFENKKK